VHLFFSVETAGALFASSITAGILVPQEVQNAALSGTEAPHTGQIRPALALGTLCSIFVPHTLQNAEPEKPRPHSSDSLLFPLMSESVLYKPEPAVGLP